MEGTLRGGLSVDRIISRPYAPISPITWTTPVSTRVIGVTKIPDIVA